MKKKIIIGILVLITVIFSVYKFSINAVVQNKDDRPVIKIGVIFPLTGELAHMGENAKVAIQMFQQDIKNSKYAYKILLEDDRHDPKTSILIAKKMIAIDKVDVIVTIGSNISNAISPITEENKVLHFAISTDENVARGDYNFTIATPPNKLAEKLITELQKKNQINVAVVVLNNSYSLAMIDALKKANSNNRINILSETFFNPGERDFRISIHKILRDKPNIIAAFLHVPEISIFTRQLKEINSNLPVTTTEVFLYPKDKSIFNDYWYVDGTVEKRAYTDRFEIITGHRNVDYSPYLYTIFEILNDAFLKEGKNKGAIIQYLTNEKNTYEQDTVLGIISFNNAGVMQSEPSLKKIENGQPILIEE